MAPATQALNNDAAHIDEHAPAVDTEGAAEAADQNTWEMPFHQVAGMFPMMSDLDLEKLAEDIRIRGLQEPIWTWEGQIIDGRNRYRACEMAGVEPAFRVWDGVGSLVEHVLSLNLHRRHLDPQQRAMVAAQAKAALEEEGRRRREFNLRQNRGAPEELDPALRPTGRSADILADRFDISADAVKKASKVNRDGAPELIQAVQTKALKLDAAVELATLPKETQAQVLAAGASQVAEVVREQRQARKARPRAAGRKSTTKEQAAVQPSPVKQESAEDREHLPCLVRMRWRSGQGEGLGLISGRPVHVVQIRELLKVTFVDPESELGRAASEVYQSAIAAMQPASEFIPPTNVAMLAADLMFPTGGVSEI